jgi:4-hydroxybenzoate polyprenyltransferase
VTSAIVRVLRPHQWSKNLLLLLPVITSHNWWDADSILAVATGIVAFCLAASSTYVFNDWSDREQDRVHPEKRLRPFASGDLQSHHAFWLVPVLAIGSLIVGLQLNGPFVAALLTYLVLSWAYCLAIRSWLWVDAMVLASLYTLRVLAGAFAIQVEPSPWLLGFSIFLFFSLAALKRLQEFSYPEWLSLSRPYRVEDRPVVLAIGTASSVASVLVLALYLNSEDMRILYQHPAWLWLLCPMLLYWLSRVWILANRGTLDADPVLFALRDRVSWLLLLMAAGCILMAT